jgi:hypothetical protein
VLNEAAMDAADAAGGNDTEATAWDLGEMEEGRVTEVTASGNLHTESDEDWFTYSFAVDSASSTRGASAAHTVEIALVDPLVDLSAVEVHVSDGSSDWYAYDYSTHSAEALEVEQCWRRVGSRDVVVTSPPFHTCVYNLPQDSDAGDLNWKLALSFRASTTVSTWDADYCSTSAASNSDTWQLTINCTGCSP